MEKQRLGDLAQGEEERDGEIERGDWDAGDRGREEAKDRRRQIQKPT